MSRPNFLLICVDQMRGDAMSCAGHEVVETPYLDTMAKNGVMFENAYSAVPSCIASRAAIMTGLSQEKHKRFGYEDGVVWDYEHTLAGGLAKHGYHTQCVGKMHVYPQRNLCGFHNVVLHDGYLHYERSQNNAYYNNQVVADDYMKWLKEQIPTADVIDTGLEANSWIARTWIHNENLHPTNWTVSQSIDFLRRRDPLKPFFLMTSFVRPHSPLDPPKFYYDMYDKKKIPDPIMGDWTVQNSGITDYNSGFSSLNKEQYDRMRKAYYGCITHIDHQIGRLLQTLMEYDVLKDTVIIFTSDHGDLLGDHGLLRKALPYEGSTRIPFILYDPGDLLNLPKGAKLNHIIELRDILPTLYEIAGVSVPDEVDGKSLLSAIRGEEWRTCLHGEHEYGEQSNHYMVTKEDKYIYYSMSGEEQYFRLDIDPDELYNKIADSMYQERIDELRKTLQEILAKRK